MATQPIAEVPIAVPAVPIGLEIQKIVDLIPHRPPILLVHEASVLSSTEIEGRLTVTLKHCAGHFEGNPFFPAVFMCEMAYQVAGLLIGHLRGTMVSGVAAGITDARFKAPVRPKETLTMKVVLLRQRHRLLWFEATGHVGERLVFTGKQTISGNVPSDNGASA